MRGTMLKLNIMQPRLLKKADAAFYVCRSPGSFEAQCPVPPIVMTNGDKVWDVHDLDGWIEGLKGGVVHLQDDEILARLG